MYTSCRWYPGVTYGWREIIVWYRMIPEIMEPYPSSGTGESVVQGLLYSGTSEQRALWGRVFCPLFGGCPFFGGSNMHAYSCWDGAHSLSIVGRLSALRSVHYRRFHCIYIPCTHTHTHTTVQVYPLSERGLIK